jgi:alpha-L-arabinofuranosidase
MASTFAYTSVCDSGVYDIDITDADSDLDALHCFLKNKIVTDQDIADCINVFLKLKTSSSESARAIGNHDRFQLYQQAYRDSEMSLNVESSQYDIESRVLQCVLVARYLDSDRKLPTLNIPLADFLKMVNMTIVNGTSFSSQIRVTKTKRVA